MLCHAMPRGTYDNLNTYYTMIMIGADYLGDGTVNPNPGPFSLPDGQLVGTYLTSSRPQLV